MFEVVTVSRGYNERVMIRELSRKLLNKNSGEHILPLFRYQASV